MDTHLTSATSKINSAKSTIGPIGRRGEPDVKALASALLNLCDGLSDLAKAVGNLSAEVDRLKRGV
jgi:hypothetical protein